MDGGIVTGEGRGVQYVYSCFFARLEIVGYIQVAFPGCGSVYGRKSRKKGATGQRGGKRMSRRSL